MKVSNNILIIIIIILVVTLFAQNIVMYGDQKHQFIQGGDIAKSQMIDSLQNRCDSLYDELFIRHVENGRYEATFEQLKEVNPKLAKEMEDWMAHETE